jgi:hypothetical protein
MSMDNGATAESIARIYRILGAMRDCGELGIDTYEVLQGIKAGGETFMRTIFSTYYTDSK